MAGFPQVGQQPTAPPTGGSAGGAFPEPAAPAPAPQPPATPPAPETPPAVPPVAPEPPQGGPPPVIPPEVPPLAPGEAQAAPTRDPDQPPPGVTLNWRMYREARGLVGELRGQLSEVEGRTREQIQQYEQALNETRAEAQRQAEAGQAYAQRYGAVADVLRRHPDIADMLAEREREAHRLPPGQQPVWMDAPPASGAQPQGVWTPPPVAPQSRQPQGQPTPEQRRLAALEQAEARRQQAAAMEQARQEQATLERELDDHVGNWLRVRGLDPKVYGGEVRKYVLESAQRPDRRQWGEIFDTPIHADYWFREVYAPRRAYEGGGNMPPPMPGNGAVPVPGMQPPVAMPPPSPNGSGGMAVQPQAQYGALDSQTNQVMAEQLRARLGWQ